MGPRARYLGPEVPAEELLWQDPIPAVNHPLIDAQDVAALEGKILAAGLSVSELVTTAWASASTFRGSDKRGGANGARIRLAPQKDWRGQPTGAARPRCSTRSPASSARSTPRSRAASACRWPDPHRARRLRRHRTGGEERGRRRDGAVHAGAAWDAAPEQTDTAAFAVLEPIADGFRNYLKGTHTAPAEALLVDKAQLLTLTAPEMTVLVGGLRVSRPRGRRPATGVFTRRPGALTNDFFV
jgi:catalase-peroxidase